MVLPLSSGVACLVALARAREVPFDSSVFVGQKASVLGDASTLANLSARAGLALEPIRASISELRDLKLPVIARGEDGEYFLIEALRDDSVAIAEPRARDNHDHQGDEGNEGDRGERGQTVLSLEQFTMRWSGVVLFERAGARHGASLGADRGIAGADDARTPHRAGRVIGGWILAGVLVLFAAVAWWASQRTVEIAAWGSAQLPPAPTMVSLRAPQAGVLRRMRVQEGDVVAVGDVLLELSIKEPVPEAADPEALIDAELDVARADAMVAAISLDATPRLRAIAGVTATRRASEERALATRFEEYRNRAGMLDAAIEKNKAQQRAADEAIASLRDGLAGARKRASEARSLFDQGFISRNALIEREERVAQLQRDLDRQIGLAADAAQTMSDAVDARRALAAEMRKTIETERSEAQQQLSALRAAAAKPRQAERVLEVRAEQAGVARAAPGVRDGDSIAPGQTLASVRPALHVSEIIATLDDARAREVRPGMVATLMQTPGGPSAMPIAARVVAVAEDGRATLRLERPLIPGEMTNAAAESASPLMVRVTVGTRSLLASLIRP